MSIEIKDLSKLFGEDKYALKDVSINFKKGKTTGLIGFNGSGKTTTFNIMAGFMNATKGSVLFEGQIPTLETYRKISYLAAGAEPKNSIIARRHLETIASLYGAEKEWALKKIKYYSKQMEFLQFLNKPIKSLSKGNQQKVKLIAAFLNPNVEYMFLDEPFDGLDPIMVDKTVKLFQNLKDVTILITSHRMEVVQEMTEEFYVLKDGKIVESRQTKDKTIFISVNKEVAKSQLEKIKNVTKIEKKGLEWILTASDITEFKGINLKLINLPKYEYSSLVAKNIAQSVFDKYLKGDK